MRSPLPLPVLLAMVVAGLPACGDDDAGLVTPPESGRIRVTASTTGNAPDPDGYLVSVDGEERTRIGVNSTVTFSAALGERAVELGDVAAPCMLAGEPRRTVTVGAGETIEVAFVVVCEPPTGSLVVTTVTTGPLPDPERYTVQVDGGPFQPIGANASLTIVEVAPGPHRVDLGGVARNCAVEGENPVTVEVTADAAAVAEFRVACTAGVARWTPMASGTDAFLTGVWADPAGGAAFAVGERDVRGGVEGVFLRLEEDRWTVQRREPDLRPQAVWGTSPSNVYAVGYGFLTRPATVLRYTGTDWASVPVFDLSPEVDIAPRSVWGSSADDIFIVGAATVGPFGLSLIYHYDGSGWRPMDLAGDVLPLLEDVWGNSATDVYAVGRDAEASPTTGVVLRYEGAAWRPVLQVERLSLNGVWSSSPNDVFAAGFQVEERDDQFFVNGAIWHYDGVAWSPMSLPPVGVLNEIWGTSAEDVYAVGDEGLILRYDGTTWTPTTVGSATHLAVWGRPGEVFVVGENGTILRGTP